MKILFVLEHFWPHIGGAETLFENLCAGLVARGNDILVVTTKLRGSESCEKRDGVEIHRVRCFNRYGFTLLSLKKIYSLAKGADIIQTTTFNAALPAWIISKILGKPCCLTVLEVWGDNWKQVCGLTFFHRLFEQFIMTLKFDAYAAISHFTKRQMTRFYGINDGKIKVICPGIDYALFDKSKYDKAESRQKLGLDGHAFYYLYFGRPGWAKGLEYLLAAVPKIAQKIPNSKLVLILSPTPKTNHRSLIKLAKKLGAEDKIVILKSVSRENLPRYIAAADCAVCPSISEGFGFMVAESCAMGIPVATTDAGSLPEVAGGKVVFVKTKDSASLADGVCHVAKGHWQEIPSKKFLWSDAIQFYEKMYAETIERFSAARSGRRS